MNISEEDPVIGPDTKSCPACGASWVGPEIPEASRDVHYGGRTHFSRILGTYRVEHDRITEWQCPDCRASWARE